jgi:UDP:flavonoid glycosyltransferase YjiC (YdhE family)
MAVPSVGPPQARHSQSPGGRTAAEPTSPPSEERGKGGRHSILYAWEFGANLGHVGAFMPLARALRAKGHEVHWMVTQPAVVGDFLASEGFTWLAAPTLPEVTRPGPPLTYADILLRFGYADPRTLFGLAGGWREAMRLTGAQLVLADHAPTALLAARTLATPVMLFSNGFTAPPRRSPLPNMRPWTPVPEQTLGQLDRAALSSINAVLARHDCAQMQHLAELFDVAEEALVTFPELDHYPDRGPARYWGSLPSAGAGQPVAWPAAGGRRIFAYLRAESPHHEAVLAALHALGQAAAIYFPDMPPALAARYSATHLSYLDQPADIEQMTREADLAITYASLATTTAFLLAGKPLLMLPGHLEQFMVARRVEEMGAGRLVNPEQPPGDLRGVLADLIDNPAWRTNAEAFAAKYAAFDQQAVTGNLVRRIDEMLDGPGSIKGMP